jgi:hypothetical protein
LECKENYRFRPVFFCSALKASKTPDVPFVSVQVVIVGDSGADAAVQTVPHEFDGIAPDIDQAVAAFVVDPPEASASDFVVAAGEENDFIAAEDPPVSPVQDGNAELVHPHVAAVPKLLPIPDAEDVGPSSVPMAPPVVVWAVMTRVLIMVCRRGGSPVVMMARLPRRTGDGEEQCDAEYLSFHNVFLLFCPIKMQLSDQKVPIIGLQRQNSPRGTENPNVRVFLIPLEISRFVLLKHN